MALGKRRREEEESQIDMTPMLDVVFIMLIFFIVTASFVNESGISVNRPPTSDQPPPDSENTNIVFRISESNELTLEGRRIDIRAVRANVERMHAEKPEAKVVISSHPKSRTEMFVMISDQAREAGVYDISLSTDESLLFGHRVFASSMPSPAQPSLQSIRNPIPGLYLKPFLGSVVASLKKLPSDILTSDIKIIVQCAT